MVDPILTLQPNGNPLDHAIDDTFGAILVANIVGAVAFGILTVQVYLYYSRFEKDPKWLKVLVATVWFLDLAHTGGTSAFSYIYGISLFDTPAEQRFSSKVVGVCLQLEPPTGLLVQLYFARRHWILNRQKSWLSGVIVFVAFVACGFGMASGGAAYTIPEFVHFSDVTYLVMVWLAGSVVVDVLVTVSVAWTLWTSKTGFRQTDRFITKVIVWTVNTGLLTALAAVLDIIFFIAADKTLIHLAFNFILAKLYSNTLLASLNRRQSAREESATHHQWTEDYKLGPVQGNVSTFRTRTVAVTSIMERVTSTGDDLERGVRVAMTTSNFADDTLDIRKHESSTYFNDLSEAERKAHGYV